MTRAHLLATLGVLAVSLTGRNARAELCPPPADTAPDSAPGSIGVADVDAEVRLEYLARAFDREVFAVDAWSWTWGSIYTAGAIAQGVAIPLTSDRGKRTDYTVGLASTAFGAVSLLALPLKLTLPLRGARRHWGDADRCTVLSRAERALVSVEKDQALATGIVAHLGNIAVNIGIALILGLGYDQWTPAALTFGIGVAVGEANAFTQPHHLAEVLADYRQGRLDALGAPPPSKIAWGLTPIVTPRMTGVALGLGW